MASSHDAEATSAPALPRSERKQRRSIGLNLFRLLRVGARRVARRQPGLPLLDGLDAAVAAAVSRIHERAVGQPRPSETSGRTSVPHRTIRDGDGRAWLEGAARDTA